MIRMSQPKKQPGAKIVLPQNSKVLYEASPKNPLWKAFTDHCKEAKISSMEELQDPPELITPMLKDEVWVDKFKIHFGNTRYQEKKKNPKKKREEKEEKKRKNK